jgi:hypothetical protein
MTACGGTRWMSVADNPVTLRLKDLGGLETLAGKAGHLTICFATEEGGCRLGFRGGACYRKKTLRGGPHAEQ